MADRMVVIQYPDGRQGAVLPDDFGNPDLAENFKGAHILRYEDGEPWDGPTTPEGLARKVAAAIEERRETRRERHDAREAARQAEVAAEPEPDAKE